MFKEINMTVFMRFASPFKNFPDILPDKSNALIDFGLPTAVPGQKSFTYREE